MLEMIDGAPAAYQPGICNIGPAEVRRRRQIGWLGLCGVVAMVAVLLAVDAPAWWRLLVALPAAASVSGFLQARMRFCAGFGLAGIQNFGEIGRQQQVADAQARAADRRTALIVHSASAAAGIAAGVSIMLLPL